MRITISIICLIVAVFLMCIACTSKSGQLVEMKMREAQAREIKKQLEITHGISVIVILHDTTFTTLNDSVAFRMVDNTYFVKRKDIILGDWRYYRIE